MDSLRSREKNDDSLYAENELALLIIAYLRPKNLKSILDMAIRAEVKRVYISIDFPKLPSEENMKLNSQVVSIAEKYKEISGLEVNIFARERNVGCSAAVLSSCDWFFEKVDKGIILEDDCIPTEDFFDFCRDSIKVIAQREDVWLACGTQFAPINSKEPWHLSKYPLTWGWATTRLKWIEISQCLRESARNLRQSRIDSISISEAIYWDAGSSRAFRGVSDAWDTPLVQKMLLNSKLAILPTVSLVSNIGNDPFATHTHGDSIGLRVSTGKYSRSDVFPTRNSVADSWLKKQFYKISVRHILTTKVTYILDLFQPSRRKNFGLVNQWKTAKIIV
jgi:hypothetical protein